MKEIALMVRFLSGAFWLLGQTDPKDFSARSAWDEAIRPAGQGEAPNRPDSPGGPEGSWPPGLFMPTAGSIGLSRRRACASRHSRGTAACAAIRFACRGEWSDAPATARLICPSRRALRAVAGTRIASLTLWLRVRDNIVPTGGLLMLANRHRSLPGEHPRQNRCRTWPAPTTPELSPCRPPVGVNAPVERPRPARAGRMRRGCRWPVAR
jgi:hypothetical protein